MTAATTETGKGTELSCDELIATAIRDALGERCPDFHADCFCCRAWARYDVLTAATPTMMPLEWEHIGGDVYRAPAPLFGSIRIEGSGGTDFEVYWSVPGFCDKLIEGSFPTVEAAKAATQARIRSAFISAQQEPVAERRPYYNRALDALEAAHKACFDHPDRGVLGMSHGPFSGVNEALGIIANLEDSLDHARSAIATLEAQLADKTRERAFWEDRENKAIIRAQAAEAQLADKTRELDEARADVDRLESEAEELRYAPWPEWASKVLAVIRKRSGSDGYDDADGVDLPTELDDVMAELEREAEQRTQEARAEREVEQHKRSAEHYREQASELRAELARQKQAVADAEADKAFCAEVASKAIKFQMSEDIYIESRGPGAWVVTDGSFVLNRSGGWEYEPMPSSRSDDFIARSRFAFNEAWTLAESAAIRGCQEAKP